jgi:hypothetical protein
LLPYVEWPLRRLRTDGSAAPRRDQLIPKYKAPDNAMIFRSFAAPRRVGVLSNKCTNRSSGGVTTSGDARDAGAANGFERRREGEAAAGSRRHEGVRRRRGWGRGRGCGRGLPPPPHWRRDRTGGVGAAGSGARGAVAAPRSGHGRSPRRVAAAPCAGAARGAAVGVSSAATATGRARCSPRLAARQQPNAHLPRRGAPVRRVTC